MPTRTSRRAPRTNETGVSSAETPQPDPEHTPHIDTSTLGTLVGMPLVGDAEYDTYQRTPAGAMVSVLPGLLGTDDQQATEDRLVDFHGYLTPMAISIREVNQLLGHDHVIVPMLRYAITQNGQPVLSGIPTRSVAVPEALIEVHEYATKLRAHPVRWYLEDDWRMRPVWYQGVPAVVLDFKPEGGNVLLGSVGNEQFPITGEDRDAAGENAPAPIFVWVNLFDTSVTWTRTLRVTPPMPVMFMDTPEGDAPETEPVPPAVHSDQEDQPDD